MKKIQLTQGKYVLVDDKDYDGLNSVSWFYDGAYAARKSPKKIYMHRIINKTPKGSETDHVNRNKLDNRRTNLRTVTSSQNSTNITIRSDNKSSKTGVFWRRERKKWGAYINYLGKRKYLGHYSNLTDAIKARKEAEEKLWTL